MISEETDGGRFALGRASWALVVAAGRYVVRARLGAHWVRDCPSVAVPAPPELPAEVVPEAPAEESSAVGPGRTSLAVLEP